MGGTLGALEEAGLDNAAALTASQVPCRRADAHTTRRSTCLPAALASGLRPRKGD